MSDLSWKVNQTKKIIKAAIKKFGPSLGVAFTGRKDSSVMMHIFLSINKKSPEIMFIDHGLHFPESIELLKKLIKKWHLAVHWEADTKLMQKLNQEKDLNKKAVLVRELKIATIQNTIQKYRWQALMSAIRWDENPARANETYFSKRKDHYRVHPMLHWSEKDIWQYIKKYKIPYNPLYDQGYRSIGEMPFTKKADGGERSGREAGKEELMGDLRKLGYF